MKQKDIRKMAEIYYEYLDRRHRASATRYIMTIRDTFGKDVAERVIQTAAAMIISED